MRYKLIHNYFGADLEKIWLTIKEDLLTLFKELQPIKRKYIDQGDGGE